jgi:hypothetical protein
MTYLGVSDLKQSKKMWEILAREKEVILTKDGKPGALILEISPEGVEATVAAVRRALFSEAASAARDRASLLPPRSGEIEAEIKRSRNR